MSAADLATACRMLKACECLYSIGWGSVTKSPAYPGVGFRAEPSVFEVGTEKIDACLVGHNNDGVILAFRGTILLQPDKHFCQSLRDWANDFNFALADVPGIGKVHAGIWGSLDRLWPKIRSALSNLLNANPSLPLYVTGHSKGALLASYAALRLAKEEEPQRKVRAVHVFGSPRVGGPDFADLYNKTISAHWRFDGCNDIVPFLPQLLPCLKIRKWFLPRDGSYDYRQVGTLQYIDGSNRIRGDTRGLRARRAARLLWTLLFRNVITAHLLPTGYQPGVCHETPQLYGPHVPYGHTAWFAALRCVLHHLGK